MKSLLLIAILVTHNADASIAKTQCFKTTYKMSKIFYISECLKKYKRDNKQPVKLKSCKIKGIKK